MNLETGSVSVSHAFAKDGSALSPEKRIFDITLSALSLLFLMLLLLLIVVALLVTQGRPIVYRHVRLGKNGRHFHCLKFRSMVSDADEVLHRYLAERPEAAAEWARNQKLSKDPRITPFGSFLRKSSFDEFPQLINVLLGEMSLVGPRPIVPDELARYGEAAGSLMSVPPGVTGLWQVNGRSNVSYKRRIELDLIYIRNWSLSGDMKIIARTVPAVLRQHGSV